MQEVHIVGEVQSEQFVGQSKQVLPLDKYRPTSHVSQDYVVDCQHVKQFAEVQQHSLSESKEQFYMHEIHNVGNVHDIQFIGQSKQVPLDKYRPTSHV